MANKNINTNKELLNVLSTLAPGIVKKNPLLSSSLLAEDLNNGPSLEDMPSDEEMQKKFGDETPAEGEDTQTEDNDEIEVPNTESEEVPADEPDAEPEAEEKVGPYDLTFHLRKIISAFDQVTREAEQLRKLTEGISANMSSEQQASWIEQRRFFIETAKEAEAKWTEFKKVLLNFSLTPRL